MLDVGRPLSRERPVVSGTQTKTPGGSLTHRTLLSCLLAATFLSAGIAMSGQARQAQATSPETRARMIRLIGMLESDPFNPDAREQRRDVLLWLTEAPDVSVAICVNVLGDVKKLKGDEGSALIGQFAYAQARFILENPSKAGDKLAVNVAGVEGVLATYQAMRKSKPKLTFDHLEKLSVLRAEGTLQAFIEKALANC
jgi:hypothetical protein